MRPIVQCVPNFSEGRRPEVIDAIVDSVRNSPGVRLVDWSADTDHNRMVVTYVGEPLAVINASLAAADTAVRLIDLNKHTGVHPRIGAIDVFPFVPIRAIDMVECAKLAVRAGNEIAERLKLPVFLYDFASEERRTLPDIRKYAFKSFRPDLGPINPHPTAGGVVIGARNPLIAYNINLQTSDVSIAKVIANELRKSEISGFTGIRALGLLLSSRNLSQVSMNITQPDIVSLNDVFRYVCMRAGDLGADVVESEIIGALPGFTAYRQIAESLKCATIKPGQVLLENWPDQTV